MKDPVETFPPTADGKRRLEGRSAAWCSWGELFFCSADSTDMRVVSFRSEFVSPQENMCFARTYGTSPVFTAVSLFAPGSLRLQGLNEAELCFRITENTRNLRKKLQGLINTEHLFLLMSTVVLVYHTRSHAHTGVVVCACPPVFVYMW